MKKEILALIALLICSNTALSQVRSSKNTVKPDRNKACQSKYCDRNVSDRLAVLKILRSTTPLSLSAEQNLKFIEDIKVKYNQREDTLMLATSFTKIQARMKIDDSSTQYVFQKIFPYSSYHLPMYVLVDTYLTKFFGSERKLNNGEATYGDTLQMFQAILTRVTKGQSSLSEGVNIMLEGTKLANNQVANAIIVFDFVYDRANRLVYVTDLFEGFKAIASTVETYVDAKRQMESVLLAARVCGDFDSAMYRYMEVADLEPTNQTARERIYRNIYNLPQY